MPRFTAEIRFDAPDLANAKSFGRGLRQAARTRNGHEWERRNARLLRITAPDPEPAEGAVGRYAAKVKFDAPDLSDARVFAQDVRRAGRAGIPFGRFGSVDYAAWTRRNAALLKLVDVATPENVAADATEAE